MALKYLIVFAVGGGLCLIGQLLINYTKLTTARILIIYLVVGAVLTSVGIYQYVVDVAGCGATVPIIGFGYSLAKGAMDGAKQGFWNGIFGGIKAASAGLTAAIFFSYIFGIIFKSKTKKV